MCGAVHCIPLYTVSAQSELHTSSAWFEVVMVSWPSWLSGYHGFQVIMVIRLSWLSGYHAWLSGYHGYRVIMVILVQNKMANTASQLQVP